jgi:hypothetical protein
MIKYSLARERRKAHKNCMKQEEGRSQTYGEPLGTSYLIGIGTLAPSCAQQEISKNDYFLHSFIKTA